MGLDTVEMIMRVEEDFGIEIEDEEASELDTVGKLYQCILGKLGFNQPELCLRSVTFYRIRRAMMELFEIPRNQVVPATHLENLLPVKNRKMHWRNLSQKMDSRLPDLELPDWLIYLIICLFYSLWIAAGAIAIMSSMFIAVALFGGSFLFIWAAFKATAPLAVCLPQDCATVRGVVKAAMRLNYGIYLQDKKTWNQTEVWEMLRAIIAEELSVNPEQVTEDADFVRDLHAD